MDNKERFYLTDIYEDQNDIPTSIWPMCAINNCKNRCCLSLGSEYCFPHTQDKNDLNLYKEEIYNEK